MNLDIAKIAYSVIMNEGEKNLNEKFKIILDDDPKWERILNALKNTVLKIKNIDSFTDEIKPLLKANEEDIDYDDIKNKIIYLINQASLVKIIDKINSNLVPVDILTGSNGEKKLTFQMEPMVTRVRFEYVKRENIGWLIILVTYIQSKYGMQSNEKFSETFLTLTKGLLKQKPSNILPSNQTIEKQSSVTRKITASEDPTVPQKKSLVLVFGQSYFASVDNMNEKTNIDNDDFHWLIKGVEWYWFGSDFEELPSDPNGNVCLLKIDVKSSEQEISGKIQLKNLLKQMTEQKIPLLQIKSKPGERYQLASFKDKGFRQ
jgi:hypothetical protein